MYTGGGMYTGNGGFWKSLKKYGKKAWNSGLGKRMRSFAADELAMAAGGFVPGAGGPVRDALRKAGLGMYTGGGMYTGNGAYQQVANDLIAGGHETEGIMRFDVQNDEDCIVVSHSEYVMDIYAPPKDSTTGTVKLPLNAGQAKTFPMLSQIAANFEDFQIVQLGFTYKPSLSDWQTTNGQVGQVLIATNYNPEAPLWTTKQQLLAQTGSTSARTIDSTLHGVECDPSKHHNDGHYLTRTGPPRPDEDLNDYDHGWTQVTVVDTPAEAANITLGELHVSYTIKLSKPRIWQSAHNIVPRWIAQDWTSRGQLSGTFYSPETNSATGFKRFALTSGDSDRILLAKQNTIDAIVKTGPMPLAEGETVPQSSSGILFPANLTGDFRLTFVMDTDLARDFIHSFQGQLRDIGNQTRASGDWVPTKYCDGVPGYKNLWLKSKMQGNTSGTNQSRVIGYVDFHIDVARDGIDNILFFCCEADETAMKFNGLKLELTGINTTLQWRQDGGNDAIIMVDYNHQIVTF